MQSPLAFLRFVAKAALNVVGFGVAGDFAVEVLPDVARDLWRWWGQDRPPEELRAEVEAVARLEGEEARRHAEQAAAEVAAGRPESVRRALTAYLAQVPAAVRRSQRRPADPGGRTVAADLPLGRPADLLPLLPARLPRFKPGDRPAGIGDWELEELLGVGGFGEVWKARNPHLAEPVALKFCLDPAAARVLRNEAALLGRVMSQGKHPGIVRLLHTYLGADIPCLEYEYVAGGDLAGLIGQWHRAGTAFRPEQATRLLQGLAGIVAFAHRLDPPIVHRDLKPANVLLQPTARGTVALRVADFGIGGVAAGQALAPRSRSLAGASSLTLAVRGAHTPLYASPQQARGEPPDPRDDVHALGVIWYQLLTGDLSLLSLPADWQDELAERQVNGAAVRLLGACLASRPDKRPASAAVLADELAALLSQQSAVDPAVPAPPSGRPAAPPVPPPEEDLAAQVQRTLRHSAEVHEQARRRAYRDHDYAGAVELLEEVPLHLRDAELYVALCQRRDRVAELERQVRAAVQEGRFARLRHQVEELLEMVPQRDDLRRLLHALPHSTPLERQAGFWKAPPPGQAGAPEWLTNAAGMDLMLVPAGAFLMGSPDSEAQRDVDEGPCHKVTITRPYYLGVHPVTQREYAAVTGRDPTRPDRSKPQGPRCPVTHVSWADAVAFCRQLSDLPGERAAGRVYRLPTEAEWEYACRAGTATPFYFGASASSALANFNGRHPYGGARKGPAHEGPTAVGSYPANDCGLFDMHGNVWEWCADWYDRHYYGLRVERDPTGPADGDVRVLRGGAFSCPAYRCRSAARYQGAPGDYGDTIGFRVALTAPAWAP
jgi:formylglycine-generating enzyme required for sulfatase activity/serine/threonine protein kinase